MHQHISVLNLTPLFRLVFSSLLTFIVFTSVTIGIGAVIHISKANARGVSLGLISCFIFGELRGQKYEKLMNVTLSSRSFTLSPLMVYSRLMSELCSTKRF